jgi:hypothetical protein
VTRAKFCVSASIFDLLMSNAFKCDGCDELTEGSPAGVFETGPSASVYEGKIFELCAECTEEISQGINNLDNPQTGLGY